MKYQANSDGGEKMTRKGKELYNKHKEMTKELAKSLKREGVEVLVGGDKSGYFLIISPTKSGESYTVRIEMAK